MTDVEQLFDDEPPAADRNAEAAVAITQSTGVHTAKLVPGAAPTLEEEMNKKERESAVSIVIHTQVYKLGKGEYSADLENLLRSGWKPPYAWTDKELEDYLDAMQAEARPVGAVQGR